MAHLLGEIAPQKQIYVDKKSGLDRTEWIERLKNTRTVYVGNLSFYTAEEQLFELFAKTGTVERVQMGLNRHKKSPCGFAFVEFATHEQAKIASNLVDMFLLDDREIRVDPDAGFSEGRQYGRGETGNQCRDDMRSDFDPSRGGDGAKLLRIVKGDDRQFYVGKRSTTRAETEEKKKQKK
eukprot:GEMP01105152.1.p1 GENE.GEMP01105152.1~~GEMP01105152.1.p1  ORF type:complete len:180 (-),score=37.38 GEMP01105152.1:172-711(-)